MTPSLPLLGGDSLVISPSQLQVIKTCPTMWRYKHLFRRIKAGANGAPVGGKAFDNAMNIRYTKLGSAPVLAGSSVEQEMHAAIDAEFAGKDLPAEEYRNPVLYRQAVDAYNLQWAREAWEILAVQLPFAVELGSIPVPEGTSFGSELYQGTEVRIILQGILDMLVRLDNKVLVLDTKTMARFSDLDMIQWENNGQSKAYSWGLQELARRNPALGLPEKVSGFVLNACILRPPYKNESRKPTAKDLPRIEFRRPIFLYTQEQLEEWRTDTLAWIGMALQWVANDHFPQNEKSCANHYGKACPYLGVCTFPKTQREMILASDEYRDYERAPQFATATTTTI